MSTFSGYKTKAFSETQKFFVLDPNTGSPAFVQGSDLIDQITPNSNYVYSESTRTTAQATDYPIGSLIQTSGGEDPGDNLASVYLVVASGEGDFPMQNGNELLVVAGDDTLREQLAASPSAGQGANLVNGATIYIGSVAEGISGLTGVDGQAYQVNGWHSGATSGGGVFVFKPGIAKSEHNGGTIISPTVPAVSAQSGSTFDDKVASFLNGIGETDSAGSGVFVRTEVYQITPEMFGAKGDGITNDTDCLFAASQYIEGNDGGTLLFGSNKVYLVGKQDFAGQTGLGYAYRAHDVVKISNCTKPVVVDLNGSVIRFKDGLKFGSYDPVTGDPFYPTLPFTDADYKAEIGTGIQVLENASITIRNGEVDGSEGAIELGGQWGDRGYQLFAYGVRSMGSRIFNMSDVYTHNHGLDGLLIGNSAMSEGDPARPTLLVNVVSETNARQGFSWVGGIGLTAINCKFNKTGRGQFSSSPGAGVDIEAENSVCRDGLFINCEVADNVSNGFIADVGDIADILCIGCDFYGTSANSVWPKMPRMKFQSCSFSGRALANHTTTIERDRTQFVDCTFTPKVFEGKAAFSSQLFDASAEASYTRCAFYTEDPAIGLGASVDSVKFRDCSFYQNGFSGTAFIRGEFQSHNTIQAETGAVDFGQSRNLGETEVTGAATFLSTGIVGTRMRNKDSYPFESLWSFGKGPGNVNRINRILYNTAAPTAGNYVQGDRVFNSAPSAGGKAGWICVTSGSPGTWKAFGAIDA